MAYISTEEVKAIREELKAEFGNKFKFGVRKGAGSLSVRVTLLSGTTNFNDILDGREYIDINHYWLGNYGKHEKLFSKIVNIIKTAPGKVSAGGEWYDNSDAMTDYFDTAYYFNIHVGAWDKPYKVIKRNMPKANAKKARVKGESRTAKALAIYKRYEGCTRQEIITYIVGVMAAEHNIVLTRHQAAGLYQSAKKAAS